MLLYIYAAIYSYINEQRKTSRGPRNAAESSFVDAPAQMPVNVRRLSESGWTKTLHFLAQDRTSFPLPPANEVACFYTASNIDSGGG